MERARRITQRRRPPGVSTSPQSASEASFDLNSSTSPTTANASGTPQTAPQGRRGSKPLHHAFTFSTPGNHRGSSLKKRSQTMDNYAIADEDRDAPKKGGHSLRKRARVDYTFEHIDDDVLVPNSTSSARGRKRRSEANFEAEDFYSTDMKRRGASMGADTPSSRRRNPSRKSAEAKAYREHMVEEDDNDVQDTIEVGVSYSDVDESEFHATSLSNPSSPHSEKAPTNSEFVATKSEEIHKDQQPPLEPITEPKPKIEEIPLQEKVEDVVENSIEEDVDQAVQEAVQQVVEQAVAGTVEQLSDTSARPIEQSLAPQTSQNINEQSEEPTQPPSIVQEVSGTTKVSPPPMSITPTQLPNNNRSSPINIIKQEVIEREINPASRSPSPNQEDKMVIDTDVDVAEANDSPNQEIEMTDAKQRQESVPKEATPAPSPPSSSPIPALEPIPSIPTSPSPSQDATPSKQDHLAAPSPKPSHTIQPSPQQDVNVENPPPNQETEKSAEDLDIKDTQQEEDASKVVEQPSIKDDERFTEESASSAPAAKVEELLNGTPQEIQEDSALDASRDISQEILQDSLQDIPTIEEKLVAPEPSAEEKQISTPPPSDEVLPSTQTSQPNTPSRANRTIRAPRFSKPQPAPVGRLAYLTPYIEDEYVSYPEKKTRDEEATGDDQTPEDKDADKDTNDMEPMVEDNDDSAEPNTLEAPTPALNTPTRGSPVPESMDPTTFNSPAPAGDEPDEADISESQEPPDRRRYFKYRKLRDPEEYLSLLENYEDMSTADLHQVLEAINVSLVAWQDEWTGLGKTVDDYENSLRRRAADSKYEARTRNLHQHGINYEEPDFAVKGYKAKEKEVMNETRYLQSQDRIMAAAYGFEYDPHPSKIGKQNPETQQSGIMTRGRSLRNQPRQTAKATETEEVLGKRQRKPVQLFEPPTQDVSRASTPAPTRGRRRRGVNADADENQVSFASSFNTEVASDNEGPAPKRRKRGARGKANIAEEYVPTPEPEEQPVQEEAPRPTRRGRGKPAPRYGEPDPHDFAEKEAEPEPEYEQTQYVAKQADFEQSQSKSSRSRHSEPKPRKRHILTLKIPRGDASTIADNGDSRPSTADSESSHGTIESSYSFRPKRQKRWRNGSEEASEEGGSPPSKKRFKRTYAVTPAALAALENPAPSTVEPTPEPVPPPVNRKVHKIKVVRNGPESSRNGTPSSSTNVPDGSEEPQKDYKSMTKSEKMSASMKNRWANGNMAGAVEKRKATLAAKKAALAVADQKNSHLAPKPKGKTALKKEAAEARLQHQQQPPPLQPQQQPQHMHMPPHHQQLPPHPPPPPHHHPYQPPHPHQHQHQFPPGGNTTFVHGMPPMGYPYQPM